MNKLILCLLTVVLSANLFAAELVKEKKQLKEQSITVKSDFSESFDEWNDIAPEWTVIDNNNDFKSWSPSSENPHTGSKCVKIGFAKPNDDWLISPKLAIGEASELKLWARSNGSTYPESFNVKLSETNREIEDFTATMLEVTDLPGDYTEYTIDLSAYNGKSIYLAVQNISDDMYNMFLDDISVTNAAVDAGDTEAPEFVSLNGHWGYLGEQLNLELNVSDESGVAGTIQATYSLSGSTCNLTMTLAEEKGEFLYRGTIDSPTEIEETEIMFQLADNNDPANTAEVTKTISWFDSFDTYSSSFEELEDFAIEFSPWQQLDLDGKPAYGYTGYDFPNEYYTGSFIVFNPEQVTPALAGEGNQAHTGDKYLACFAAQDTEHNDDWLISPKVNIEAGHVFEFWAKSASENTAERFKVGVSTTGTATGDFTIISQSLHPAGTDYVEVPSEWTKYTFALDSYVSDEPIRVAINCVSADALVFMLDDIKIGAPSADLEAPQVMNVAGTIAPMGTEMPIEIELIDATGIGSVTAKVLVNGEESSIEMTPVSKINEKGMEIYTFSGSIPAQDIPATGTITFEISDNAEAANSTISDEFDIEWYDSNWHGAFNATSTTAIGLNNETWQLGVTLDFGDNNVNIQKIAYVCHGETVGSINWKVLDVNDDNSFSENELVASRLLTDSPFLGEVGCDLAEIEVNDNTVLSGKVALVLDFQTGGLLGFDERAPHGISYILSTDGWAKLGEGDWADFAGDWTLKCYVEGASDIATEVIPGTTELYQNYPNPFNPATTIRFRNNINGLVKLTVYNVKGEQVKQLINGNMNADIHKVSFNASDLNSGVYYYKLETPAGNVTKKMMLVK